MKNLFQLCALTLALVTTLGAAPAATRPNFLFIYTDDQRYDAMSVVQREQGDRGRFPWFKTPNMDRLAAEGVRFRNAFVTSSLCSPSRASFLTGQYNHINGVVNNHTPFPINNVTHASVLRAAGYKTGYIGKWHMGQQRGQRPGFDYSASYIAHGRYMDCPFEINGVSQPTTGWVDDVSTDFAIGFLRTNKNQSFDLVVGIKSPHGPRTPPERLKNAFAGEVCRPAPSEAALAPFLPDERKAAAEHRAIKPNQGKPIAPDKRLDYFRCIAGADENLGRILNALDELGLTENTMVIYSSDNGYYFNEHGLGDKRAAYEEGLRIPLLLRYPKLGLKGALVDEMALNIDLAPTMLDYAGLPANKGMQGASWRPLLERKGSASVANWRHAFFNEYFFETGFIVPTLVDLRTETSKLIKYPGHEDWTEMFDLKTDPYETNNLANDPNQKVMRVLLQSELDKEAQKVNYRVPDFVDKPDAPAAKPKRPGAKKKQLDSDQ